ncbi:MAG TPA: UDP-3-O-(3-hydroxymyristoyl)glucosamine N-acyltransferase [Deltaproteobacteria bacterium]|nr:UDP-3-O-(3-hydroxymyristoyl)glucosamine N-acyltransferase [Deltaproteobacteria bacterium]
MAGLSLRELAGLAGGRVVGDGGRVVTAVAPLEEAGPGDIAFVADRRSGERADKARGAALIVEDEAAFPGRDLIVVKNPRLAFARIAARLHPYRRPAPGVHPRAWVHEGARLGRNVSVGPFASIDEGAVIGDDVVIGAAVCVGRDAVVGAGSIIHANVSIREEVRIGERVVIHCNSVVGSDGFGYATEDGRHHKIPQVGTVRIEDDVEIGACVTVDRATMGETVIGAGTKIDNLVQVAHNVRIGRNAIIVSQAGIAGSTKIGDGVVLAGQVGVVGHVEIGDGAVVGAQSGVAGDLEAGGVYMGSPAIEQGRWLRAAMLLPRLPELRKRVSELERRLEELERESAGSPGEEEG